MFKVVSTSVTVMLPTLPSIVVAILMSRAVMLVTDPSICVTALMSRSVIVPTSPVMCTAASMSVRLKLPTLPLTVNGSLMLLLRLMVLTLALMTVVPFTSPLVVWNVPSVPLPPAIVMVPTVSPDVIVIESMSALLVTEPSGLSIVIVVDRSEPFRSWMTRFVVASVLSVSVTANVSLATS